MDIKQQHKKVILTGLIPQCPYCEKPTKRTGSMAVVTAMYFQPMFDENGNNINPDKNIRTEDWHCCDCDRDYTTYGNSIDGYHYKS